MTDKDELELNRKREVVLHNTETLLKLYKKTKNKMSESILKRYGNDILKLLDDLDYFDRYGKWY